MLTTLELVLIVVLLCLIVINITWISIHLYRRFNKQNLDDDWKVSYADFALDGHQVWRRSIRKISVGIKGTFTQSDVQHIFCETCLVKLDHPNIVRFCSANVSPPHVCIITEYCDKGSLSDALLTPEITLSWDFRLSFIADIMHGMEYLHTSKIYHGHFKSNNCIIDDRWKVKIADYGLKVLRQKNVQYKFDQVKMHCKNYNRVYVPPEHRHMYFTAECDAELPDGTASGDVYPFGVILVEIATRSGPYGDEYFENLGSRWKPKLPLHRERGENKCAKPKEYNETICQCLEDSPEKRPSYTTLLTNLRQLYPNLANPIDSMILQLEKYSTNLEVIVSERTKELEAMKFKTDKLLYSMLPVEVANELRIGQTHAPDWYDECTIYVSSIEDFVHIAHDATPHMVVNILNHLYHVFDHVIDKYNVYQLEAIGDKYIVVSGIPTRNKTHAQDIANLALEIIDESRRFKIPHLDEATHLRVRIGIHSGAACAGVVGLKMPRYCLFGETVNVALKMCELGQAFKIHITRTTYKLLRDTDLFDFIVRGKVLIKGIATPIISYWLQSKRVSKTPYRHLPQIDENMSSHILSIPDPENNEHSLSLIKPSQDDENVSQSSDDTLGNTSELQSESYQ